MEGTKAKKQYHTSLVNRSKLKDFALGFKVTKEYMEKLEKKLEILVKESMVRAKGNRRSTLLRRDV